MPDNNNSKRGRVVVVGGGLAGLATSLYLARAGQEVLIFEKAHETGGRAITNVYGDFHFNLGPHAIYPSGPAEQVLKELGIQYHGKRVSNNGFVTYKGEVISVASAFASFFRPKLLGYRDFVSVLKFLTRIFTLKPENFAGITLQDWLDKTVATPTARQTLTALNRVMTYTNAPEIQSAGLFITQAKRLLSKGVMYIDDGWQTLVDGMGAAAREAGVTIKTGERVVAVEGRGVVEGVRLASGEFVPASAVIIAGSPQEAAQLVDSPAIKKVAETSQPAKAACLQIGLKKLPNPKRKAVYGVDEPLYYSVHSAYARLGPEGSAMIYVAKYLPVNSQSTAREDERELEAFMDRIQPGWRSEVIEKRFLPHLTVNNAIPTAKDGGLPGRIGPAVDGWKNLYLVGDWVGPQGLLLDAVLASARQAAGLVVDLFASGEMRQDGIEGKLGRQPAGSL